MTEKSSDPLDLENFAVDEAEVAPLHRRKRRCAHEPGFVLVPVGVKERLKCATGETIPGLAEARSLMLALLEAHRPGKQIIVTNALAEECGVSRRQKRRALEILAERGLVILHLGGERKNPRVELVESLLG